MFNLILRCWRRILSSETYLKFQHFCFMKLNITIRSIKFNITPFQFLISPKKKSFSFVHMSTKSLLVSHNSPLNLIKIETNHHQKLKSLYHTGHKFSISNMRCKMAYLILHVATYSWRSAERISRRICRQFQLRRVSYSWILNG